MTKQYPPFVGTTAYRNQKQPNGELVLFPGMKVEVIDEGYTAARVRDPRNGRQLDVPYEYISIPLGSLPWLEVASHWVDAIRFYKKKVFKLLPGNSLQVRFLDGAIAEYPDITEAEWDDFVQGGKDASYGGWLWDNVVKKRPYTLLRGPTGRKKPARRFDAVLRKDRLKPKPIQKGPGHWTASSHRPH